MQYGGGANVVHDTNDEHVVSPLFCIFHVLPLLGEGAHHDVQHDQLRGAEVGDREADHR